MNEALSAGGTRRGTAWHCRTLISGFLTSGDSPTKETMGKRLQPRPKRVVRSFTLTIDFRAPGFPFQKWAEEVVECIEVGTLCAFSPGDASALDTVLTNDGEEDFGAKLSSEESIREWLPVGCQLMGWSESFGRNQPSKEEGVLGRYWHNAHEMLFPSVAPGRGVVPPGPAGFMGRIILYRNSQLETEDVFKWILAHELVHCFDTLSFLIPAARNWKNFWWKSLKGGEACDIAQSRFGNVAQFLDNYGNYGLASELAAVKRHWPSHADRWFKASHPNGATAKP